MSFGMLCKLTIRAALQMYLNPRTGALLSLKALLADNQTHTVEWIYQITRELKALTTANCQFFFHQLRNLVSPFQWITDPKEDSWRAMIVGCTLCVWEWKSVFTAVASYVCLGVTVRFGRLLGSLPRTFKQMSSRTWYSGAQMLT